VHGLNGHPYKSWQHGESLFYWPIELAKLIPTARVMTFGYTADFNSGRRNQMGVRQHAESLLQSLRNNRQHASQKRPLAFVCHSLGGIVTKQVLLLSSSKQPDQIILESTKLVVFLGTPHRGSHMLTSKRIAVLERMAKLASKEVPAQLKATLHPHSDELFAINDDFGNIQGDIAIVNFYEQKKVAFLNELVVDKESAVLHGLNVESTALYRDHSEIVKFRGADDDAFKQISETVHRKVEEILAAESQLSGEQQMFKLRKAFLDSLLPEPDITQNRLSEISDPSSSTLTWLDKDEVGLLNWLEYGKGIFWVSGKPGSGKSVLMKEVYVRLQHECDGTNTIVAHHFFNNQGSQNEHSFEGFLRSILAQIVQESPDLFNAIVPSFCRRHRQALSKKGPFGVNMVQWTLRSLKDALNTVAEKGSSVTKLYLVVDALDECSNVFAGAFKAYMEQLSKRSARITIKFVVSSRNPPNPSQDDDAALNGFNLQDMNLEDIANFVHEKWSTSVLAEEHSEDIIAIRDEIIKGADGIFLWVGLIFVPIAQLGLQTLQTNEYGAIANKYGR
jgi:hypothetical protein